MYDSNQLFLLSGRRVEMGFSRSYWSHDCNVEFHLSVYVTEVFTIINCISIYPPRLSQLLLFCVWGFFMDLKVCSITTSQLLNKKTTHFNPLPRLVHSRCWKYEARFCTSDHRRISSLRDPAEYVSGNKDQWTSHTFKKKTISAQELRPNAFSKIGK